MRSGEDVGEVGPVPASREPSRKLRKGPNPQATSSAESCVGVIARNGCLRRRPEKKNREKGPGKRTGKKDRAEGQEEGP
jgi:hypothetical protein